MTEHVEQPLPIPNDQESVHDRVAAAIMARKAVGIERYGIGLQPFNGRDALRDANEEILDLAAYFQQLIDEQSPVVPLVNAAWRAVRSRQDRDDRQLGPLVQLYLQLDESEQFSLAATQELICRVSTLAVRKPGGA